ncbi:hypothetical protein OH77DRAFT_1525627 [Trametes cingulata]|nr:hypothetical protein OH77DRAFT_1525627 [Trametes cingulata]
MECFVPAPAQEDEPLGDFPGCILADSPKPESAVYAPLVTILNAGWLSDNFVARATPHMGDTIVQSTEKIDGGLYLLGDALAPADTDRTDRSTTIELSIECKTEEVQHDLI